MLKLFHFQQKLLKAEAVLLKVESVLLKRIFGFQQFCAAFLEQTPPGSRREIMSLFNESFKEEFMETIQSSPELKLIMGGASIFGVVRYMVDRELLQNDQLKRLDGIMRKIA